MDNTNCFIVSDADELALGVDGEDWFSSEFGGDLFDLPEEPAVVNTTSKGNRKRPRVNEKDENTKKPQAQKSPTLISKLASINPNAVISNEVIRKAVEQGRIL